MQPIGRNKAILYLAVLVIIITVLFLAYYYERANLTNGSSVTQISRPVSLNISIQEQSSGWNIYTSPQFQVQFKYPNFSQFGNTVDGGVSAQGQADAAIHIRPDNQTSVNDFLNTQVINQRSGGNASSLYDNSSFVEVVNVDNQSGDLVIANGTVNGDSGEDVLVVKYPQPIKISNSVEGSQTYSYLVVRFTDMNISIIKEVIGTIKFIGSESQ